MIAVGELLLSALASAAAFRLCTLLYRKLTCPLRHLPGPKGTSSIYGNLLDIWRGDNLDAIVQELWVNEYGKTLKFKGPFCSNWLLTMDVCAINHILTHANDYKKGFLLSRALAQILGEGVAVAEGSQHRQQRRVMSPAFAPAQIRGLNGIFMAKAIYLHDLWSSEIANPAVNTNGAHLEIMAWMSRMTIDVIGLAGFNYDIDALGATEKRNALNVAFATVSTAIERIELDISFVLQAWFPPLRLIPSDHTRKIQAAQRAMGRIGKGLLTKAKAAVLAGATEEGGVKKSSIQDRDLLTLLVKANMATDIPENQRLSDEDVLGQVPTFLVAGHETTSTSTTWALHELSLAPEIQRKLREEFLSVDTETPSMDELSALPYLDAVVKETLRVHPPIGETIRVATKDDILPLEKPFTDKHGVVHDGIRQVISHPRAMDLILIFMKRIGKGTAITIPILMMNRSKELWGPDAHEFKPERWEDLPKAVSKIPGVWGHMLSFSSGPRTCIAFRFAIAEMKAFLFTLVCAFEFEPAVPVNQIGKKGTPLQHPILRGDPANKAQLPLFVKRYQRGD
ncbi:cytochrome P450 [Paxillus ammoniavirescens]|nr:cytochrome P450 [Paxillus ammoniavirescens]